MKKRVGARRGVWFGLIVFDCANPGRRCASSASGFVRAHRPLRMVGLVALVLTVVALAWVDPGSLCALPALVLALLLALRRYPGERTLAALTRLGDERRRRPAASVPCSTPIAAPMPRGGLLLACALAVRPPPPVSRATA